MKMSMGFVSLLLLFLASSERLEARVPAERQSLIRTAGDPRIPPHEPDPSVIREEAIEVDLGLARDPQATKLRLPLFGGTPVLELVLKSRTTRKEAVIWTGRIEGQPASAVNFSASKEVLIANIATQPTAEQDARYYEIRYLGGNRHVLREVDPTQLPSESNPLPPERAQARKKDGARSRNVGIIVAAHRSLLKAASGPSLRTNVPPPTCSRDSKSTIDALVVYTTKAKDTANGQDAMEQTINLAVGETNDSYERSGIQQRLRLVHVREVTDYQEAGSPDKDLRALKTPRGKLGDVLTMRDDVGADIVGLIVEYTTKEADSCGQAYVMEEESNAFESSAFAVVPSRCVAPGRLSLAHEFGHLMGARHDWADDQEEKPFRFSHGFIHTGAPRPAFRTLMSKCVRCKRVPYWSNPDVPYPPSGVAMGSPDMSKPTNNAKTLNETAETVANFRCSKN